MALRRLADTGATVFVSSHILSELAEMCSSLCVLNQGRLLASGSADEVRSQLGSDRRTLTVSMIGGEEAAATWLEAQAGVTEVGIATRKVSFEFTGSDEAQSDLMVGLMQQGARMLSFEEKRSSFEDILVGVAESNRQP